MENGHNLDDFVDILGNKGYTDHFVTNAGYPDRLKESILRYLIACRETHRKFIITMLFAVFWRRPPLY